MREALSRMRWQLTLSHLIAVAFTLVCMIAAAVVIVTLIAAHGHGGNQPVDDAQLVAQAVGGIVTSGATPELNPVLRVLANGGLRLQAHSWPYGPGGSRRSIGAVPQLRNIAYIVALSRDGSLLASSDPAGAAFLPSEQAEWGPIAGRALAGEQSHANLLLVRRGSGPAALGAYPIVDDRGHPSAAVVVATTSLERTAGTLTFWNALAIFGAATVAVLAGASLFALGSSALVAYVLARRLVQRLERLGKAAESLAAGDLSCRVEEGRNDELGQLARRFNRMAADMQRTLQELEAERDRVTGLLEARRQLIAGVSHELRTPVATARGYVESALRDGNALPADLRADLETVEREIVRLQRLIEELFTLARAAVGRLVLRLRPTDPGEVVRRLTETMAPLAWNQRRVQIVAEIAPGLPRAQVDPQRLEQIVSNLLSNAVRHTPPGGLVAAAVVAVPGAVRVQIRDTGEGIAEKDMPHIFERFYRGRSEDDPSGAGLGLALVKELTEAMGGSVEMTSTAGQGSCFAVCLPLA